jgi:hypothetical protein
MHMFFDCALAAVVWSQLGVLIPDGHFSISCLHPPLPSPPTSGGLALPPSCGRSGRRAKIWCSIASLRSLATFLLAVVMTSRFGGGGSRLLIAQPWTPYAPSLFLE